MNTYYTDSVSMLMTHLHSLYYKMRGQVWVSHLSPAQSPAEPTGHALTWYHHPDSPRSTVFDLFPAPLESVLSYQQILGRD